MMKADTQYCGNCAAFERDPPADPNRRNLAGGKKLGEGYCHRKTITSKDAHERRRTSDWCNEWRTKK